MLPRPRAALACVLTLLALAGVPARAEDPTMLVAARADGALVRVDLVGRMARVTVLVPGDNRFNVPTQARGNAVTYVSGTERGADTLWDASVLDAATGKSRALTRDGRAGHVLVSPDGRTRYVLTTAHDVELASLVRVGATGRRTTLIPYAKGAQLSGAGLSPDGRTIYLARTSGLGRSTLLAVDTRTGVRRVVEHDGSLDNVWNVVVSPDGRSLAVTFTTEEDQPLNAMRVSLVSTTNGTTTPLRDTGHDLHASSFTPDGSGVVVGSHRYPFEPGIGNGIAIADVATGVVTPILGAEDLVYAVAVA